MDNTKLTTYEQTLRTALDKMIVEAQVSGFLNPAQKAVFRLMIFDIFKGSIIPELLQHRHTSSEAKTRQRLMNEKNDLMDNRRAFGMGETAAEETGKLIDRFTIDALKALRQFRSKNPPSSDRPL